MTQQEQSVSQLRGSRCEHCGTVAFPASVSCQRCGGEKTTGIDLSGTGTVWTATIQRFAPKSPPYIPPAEGFTPFAVGYVELPKGVKVEALLDGTEASELIGSRVELVESHPVPRFATVTTTEEN